MCIFEFSNSVCNRHRTAWRLYFRNCWTNYIHFQRRGKWIVLVQVNRCVFCVVHTWKQLESEGKLLLIYRYPQRRIEVYTFEICSNSTQCPRGVGIYLAAKYLKLFCTSWNKLQCCWELLKDQKHSSRSSDKLFASSFFMYGNFDIVCVCMFGKNYSFDRTSFSITIQNLSMKYIEL